MKYVKLTRFLIFFILPFSTFLLQGCIVAAVGAGVGAVKYANAKKQEAEVSCKNSYNDYLQYSKNMDPDKIMTLNEYCD